jgi:hypothetical protein
MSLQGLTKLDARVSELLSRKRISKDDFDSLTHDQKESFRFYTSRMINDLKGEERDKFMDKIGDILSPRSKNEIWESNHLAILQEVTSFIEENGRMPLIIELVDRVGLSRQTLTKHMKEYKSHPLYEVHMDQYRMMSERLLAKMFQFAMMGNVKAGRLFFDMVGGGRGVRNQTNYIQVNNLVISEERLRELSPDQLGRIETILTEVADPQISMVKKREE